MFLACLVYMFYYFSVVPCNQVNNCGSNAQCLYDPNALSYRCRCSAGYEGDGYRCEPRGNLSNIIPLSLSLSL